MANIRKTHEEFVSNLSSKNSSIVVIGHYINARERIEVKCKKCGHTWFAFPNNLLSRPNCPKCIKEEWGKNRRLTNSIFTKRLHEINPNILLLEDYNLSRDKIKCQCLVCNKEFSIVASYLLLKQKSKCPFCSKEEGRPNARLSHEEFVKRMEQIDSDIIIIGKYKDTRSKVKCKCKKCNTEWSSIANNLLQRRGGCPNCFISKGERAIKQFLISNNIEFVYQYKFNDCRDKNPLPFDFYLPAYNLCVEYDGEFHYLISGYHGGDKKLRYTQLHDEIKTQYCKNNNIELLRIPYLEFNNIDNILHNKIHCDLLKEGDI